MGPHARRFMRPYWQASQVGSSMAQNLTSVAGSAAACAAAAAAAISIALGLAGASGKKLDETYKLAWLRGLKTTYYLRTIAATHMEKSTSKTGA